MNDDWQYGVYGYLIVINGHVPAAEARDVLTEVLSRPPLLNVEEITRRVWARTITSCTTHEAGAEDDECDACTVLAECDEWWDWSAPEGDPDANANAEGYAPLTLVRM